MCRELPHDVFFAVNDVFFAVNKERWRPHAPKSLPIPAVYSVADEADLTLLGYIAFLDPPKETAAAAIATLKASGVQVKILTGDNDIVTRKSCGR
jgi:Mg2+-importing ATPase